MKPGGPGRETMIVVPCYNEASRLDPGKFVHGAAELPEVSFVFVNDGSTDATQSVLDSLTAQDPGAFRSLVLPRNAGKAEAVRAGMREAFAAGARYVGYWDADLATPLDEITAFRNVLATQSGVLCVLGSRVRLLGRAIHRNPARHYLGRVFATVVSLMTGLGVYDTQCGAKLFRVSPETEELFARPFVSRWFFDVELLMRLRAMRVADANWMEGAGLLVEYPIRQWRDVAASKLSVGQMLRAPVELARIYRAYRQ